MANPRAERPDRRCRRCSPGKRRRPGDRRAGGRLPTGCQLDLVASTAHDANAAADYRQLAGLGIRAVRDGLRWHLTETAPGRHDFPFWRPMLAATRAAGTQVIWDILHYGWPRGLDIWIRAFADRFAAFARAAARLHRDETDAVPFWCPVNEIAFFAWAGGDAAYLNPFARGRGYELKVQLARASIAAMHARRDVNPRARFVLAEPLIAIHHDPATGSPRREAEGMTPSSKPSTWSWGASGPRSAARPNSSASSVPTTTRRACGSTAARPSAPSTHKAVRGLLMDRCAR
ncbi:MAG TPA: hypothetical protein VFN28_03775 [Amaricoccus sp.]|nr:hypothetical protein [Amaricoccus sp.]